MDKLSILNIADKRFAISCNNPGFIDWLSVSCADFLVEEYPYVKLHLDFHNIDRDSVPPGTSFRIVPSSDTEGVNFRVILAEPENREDTFRSILNVCLQCTIILKQLPVLWMHASGILYNNQAYVFTGVSGAGKSTICNILAGERGFAVLHDEIVTLSQIDERYYAWSSPLRGERPASCRQGGPLKAIFSLIQSETNSIQRISGRKAPALLAANLLRIAKVENGGLTFRGRESTELILELAEKVPTYKLYFRPDFSFWETIDQCLDNEIATSLMKV